MKFEEFELKIRERGYNIVGMNHYRQDNKCYTFCAILNTTTSRAFKAESEFSEYVFDELIEKVEVAENKDR